MNRKPLQEGNLKEKHAVAITEKAISLLDGVSISSKYPFPSIGSTCKGADQHKQRGLWKMEICQEAAHDLEPVARTDEDARLARVRFKKTPPCRYLGTVFEGTGRGGASRDDAAAFTESGVDGLCGRSGEGVVFGVKADVFELFRPNWLEGAKTNVESDGFDMDVVLFQLFEDLGGEVEAGCGGGGAAGFLGEDCLVAVAIGFAVVAVDVRGERHVAYFVEDGVEIWRRREAEGAFAELGGGDNLRFQ